MMKMDNRGSSVVEAAIYYPIIIMVVLVVIVLSLFKLDQCVMQADASVSAMNIQMEQDRVKKGRWQRNYLANVGVNAEDHILAAGSETKESDGIWNTGYCLRMIFCSQYTATRNNAMISIFDAQTTPEYWVYGKPYETAAALQTARMDDKGELEYKTGYSWNAYISSQYGGSW